MKAKMKWSTIIVAKKEMDMPPWLAAVGGGIRLSCDRCREPLKMKRVMCICR